MTVSQPVPGQAPVAIGSPYWPEGEPTDLVLPPGTMVDALRRAALKSPVKPAICFYGRVIDYRALDALVEDVAAHLRYDLGVAKGDRVLLVLQNSVQFIIAFQAILRADAVVISANPMYKTAELAHLVEETECRVAIVGADVALQIAPLVGNGLASVVVADYADFLPENVGYPLPAVLTTGRAERPADPAYLPWPGHRADRTPVVSTAGRDDLALLIYTSGTTGKPKACMHTHSALLFTAQAQVRWYRVDDDSVVAAFQPLFHVAGMQHSMNTPIVAGVPIVIMTRWDRDVALALIERHGITYLNAPPTMVVDLLSSEEIKPDSLNSLRLVTGGGAAMPDAVGAELLRRTGLPYIEAYGMTEAMSPTHINPLDHPKRKCGGIPIHNTEAGIIDPATLAELGPGEVGEIVISGPQIFLGYWRRPDADKDSFVTLRGKRFYRSGDLGWRDADNYYFIGDRLKRMINASGYKVWPAEVEAMLYEHPAILECAIVSTPHDYRGEDVKAFVVLKESAPDGLSEADIVAWARDKMAVYKAPRTVVFSGPLPRTASNKIDWRILQEREWEKAARA